MTAWQFFAGAGCGSLSDSSNKLLTGASDLEPRPQSLKDFLQLSPETRSSSLTCRGSIALSSSTKPHLRFS